MINKSTDHGTHLDIAYVSHDYEKIYTIHVF